MLLTYIAEPADEPLDLEPDDRRVEWETNTRWLSAGAEDRRASTVAEVVAAFERTALLLRARVGALGHTGPATFYVRHDDRSGQLRCSTGSVGPEKLPFGGAYVPVDDLAPIVADFLADEEPGLVRLTDGDGDGAPCGENSENSENGEGPEFPPFPVRVRSVAAAG
ncbi:hypothetical protein ACFV0O_05010 [Kitasatospora sp. NPDC059577]|uniref:hypothetical protein n=1 Tax=Kitasatospora sp. NPDC059577 TaxID=3346873 RepID=UPI0036CF5ED5